MSQKPDEIPPVAISPVHSHSNLIHSRPGSSASVSGSPLRTGKDVPPDPGILEANLEEQMTFQVKEPLPPIPGSEWENVTMNNSSVERKGSGTVPTITKSFRSEFDNNSDPPGLTEQSVSRVSFANEEKSGVADADKKRVIGYDGKEYNFVSTSCQTDMSLLEDYVNEVKSRAETLSKTPSRSQVTPTSSQRVAQSYGIEDIPSLRDLINDLTNKVVSKEYGQLLLKFRTSLDELEDLEGPLDESISSSDFREELQGMKSLKDDPSSKDDQSEIATPFPSRADEYGIPLLEIDSSSDSSSSSGEEEIESGPEDDSCLTTGTFKKSQKAEKKVLKRKAKREQQDPLLPAIGPPPILQYNRESLGYQTEVKDPIDRIDEVIEGLEMDDDRQLSFQGPCDFCGNPIKKFPTLDEQLKKSASDLYCCEEYQNFIEEALTHPLHVKHLSDQKIDIKPHPPHGSKVAREAAKQKAAQRMREREIQKQQAQMHSHHHGKQDMSASNTNFYQSSIESSSDSDFEQRKSRSRSVRSSSISSRRSVSWEKREIAEGRASSKQKRHSKRLSTASKTSKHASPPFDAHHRKHSRHHSKGHHDHHIEHHGHHDDGNHLSLSEISQSQTSMIDPEMAESLHGTLSEHDFENLEQTSSKGNLGTSRSKIKKHFRKRHRTRSHHKSKTHGERKSRRSPSQSHSMLRDRRANSVTSVTTYEMIDGDWNQYALTAMAHSTDVTYKSREPKVARQMKTINYQLSSNRCMEEGWTIKPPSPLLQDNIEIFEADLEHSPWGENKGKKTGRNAGLIQKSYPDGRKYLILFPDGTGNVFYHSGRTALTISSIQKGVFSYVVERDDSEEDKVVAVFCHDGKASTDYFGGKLRLSLDQHGGLELDATGSRKKRWSWRDEENHIHAPPLQPITFSITPEVALRIISQNQMTLTFTQRARSCRFHVGTRLKVMAPDSRPGVDVNIANRYQIYREEVGNRAQYLMQKISNLLKFPKSSRVSKFPTPSHLVSKIHKTEKMKYLKAQKDQERRDTVVSVN